MGYFPRPGLIVLTDISSLTPGVREPDDAQSLIRLLVHSDAFEINALIATSNLRHGHVTRPDLIHEVLDAYAQVEDNLRLHSRFFPNASLLHKRVEAGNPVAGPDVPVKDCVGSAFDTEASSKIIRVVDRPPHAPNTNVTTDVVVWGGTADLAQALWRVSIDRSPTEAAKWRARLRVHAVHDQDTTAAWIKDTFPDLYYVTHGNSIRGMYRGGDASLVSPEWVEESVRQNHGPLGALYPNYDGGDIWSGKLGRVRGVKEGDTPSFLSIFPNGLSEIGEGIIGLKTRTEPPNPASGSWGGRFRQGGAPTRYVDAADDLAGVTGDPDPVMSTVYRWREAYQNEFAARMDWCVRPYEETNHPPSIHVAGARRRTARPGETIILNARHTKDPDGNGLRLTWSVYPAVPGVAWSAEGIRVPFEVPDLPGVTVPLLLSVTDDGDPPLTRYGRVFVTVEG